MYRCKNKTESFVQMISRSTFFEIPNLPFCRYSYCSGRHSAADWFVRWLTLTDPFSSSPTHTADNVCPVGHRVSVLLAVVWFSNQPIEMFYPIRGHSNALSEKPTTIEPNSNALPLDECRTCWRHKSTDLVATIPHRNRHHEILSILSDRWRLRLGHAIHLEATACQWCSLSHALIFVVNM